MSIKSRTLPTGWKWSKLGEVLHSIEAGKSPKAQERPADAGEWGVLKVSSVTWGEFRCQENKALFPEFKADGIPTVRAGDLLLSRANTVELVGAVAIAREDYSNLILSDKTLRLNPNLNLANPLYLLHALRTQEARTHLESHATGTSGSMRNVSQESIRNTPILIPPLEEQNRIAAILDRADAVRRKRQEAIALTEELLRSAFLEMFGDPITNPKRWQKAKIGDLLVFLTSGSRGWAQYYTSDGSLFLRIQNVKGGKLLLDDVAYVSPPNSAEARRTCVQEGDVLVSITADLGRTAVIPQGFEPAYINQHLALLRLKKEEVCPTYVAAFLDSIGGQLQFDRLNREGVKAGLNFDDIKGLEILLPPLEGQQKYERLFMQQINTLSQYKNACNEAQSLFNSLLQRAFRGEL